MQIVEASMRSLTFIFMKHVRIVQAGDELHVNIDGKTTIVPFQTEVPIFQLVATNGVTLVLHVLSTSGDDTVRLVCNVESTQTTFHLNDKLVGSYGAPT